jgi:hypothetical protein
MLGQYQGPARAKRGDGTCLLPETMYIVHLGWLDNDVQPQSGLPRDKPEMIPTATICVACGSAAPGAWPRQHWWSYICLIGVEHRLRELFQRNGPKVRVARIRDAGVVRSLLLWDAENTVAQWHWMLKVHGFCPMQDNCGPEAASAWGIVSQPRDRRPSLLTTCVRISRIPLLAVRM